jgi:CTP:phosphocholine cytidylyltransferase-like protein
MDKLGKILETCMRTYATDGINGRSYFTKNDTENVMTVVSSFVFQTTHHVDTTLMARIENARIIIEQDKTNKPLVEMLLQQGIPREQITLVYAGESIEETV